MTSLREKVKIVALVMIFCCHFFIGGVRGVGGVIFHIDYLNHIFVVSYCSSV